MARRVTRDGDVLRVEFEYDPRLVDLVKGIPGRRWNGSQRYWSVPAAQVVQLVDMLDREGFAFDEATQELYQAHQAEPDANALTVSQLNRQVRQAIRAAFPMPVWLVGELAGFDKSAHKQDVSFQLVERDPQGQVICEVGAVLFAKRRRSIQAALARAGNPFQLGDEVTVRVLVDVELHVEWGAYRVVVQDLDVAYTLGEAARRREEILRRLAKEGLTERNRSLPFPPVPLRVGLITSLGSDAESDVLRTLRESGYAFKVTVHGARVQGRSTEPSVLNALDWFRNRKEEFDVVLICRGGGSRTDLAWFDSEALGRAVATFPLPVVVGIGHEQDQSLLDAVGWRAKTPTAAAQLLVERAAATLEEMERCVVRVLGLAGEQVRGRRQELNERAGRLARAAGNLLSQAGVELDHRRARLVRGARVRLQTARQALRTGVSTLPRVVGLRVGEARAHLREVQRRAVHGARGRLEREGERTQVRARRLYLLDPRRVVERGYAVLRLEGDGVLTEARAAPRGTRLRAELKRGRIRLLSEGPLDEEGES
ncbi:MAG: exodeoxyribonuclease VII large subunit [Candidatus Bipolaricaulaceae bacterium]